jgi:hypothetical protein
VEFGILIAAIIPCDNPLLIAIKAIRTTGVRIVGLEQLILLGTRVGVFLLHRGKLLQHVGQILWNPGTLHSMISRQHFHTRL